MGNINPRKVRLKSGDTITIRSCSTSDAAKLLTITANVLKESDYLVTEPDEFNLTLKEEADWIQSYLDKGNFLMICAVLRDKIIGLLDFRAGLRRRMAHAGSFGMLVVKEYRYIGVGSALLAGLLEWAENNADIEKVSLSVFATNVNAIALYKKFGFTEEGRRIKEYRISEDRYVDDIMMYRLV